MNKKLLRDFNNEAKLNNYFKEQIKTLKKEILRLGDQNFQLKYLIDNFPGDIYWKDKSGKWSGLNKRCAESLLKMGFINSPYESAVVGKTDYQIFNKNTADIYRKTDLEVMKNKLELAREEATLLSTGEVVTLLSIKKPILNKKGQACGVIGNTIDITNIKKIENELKLAKEAAESASRAKTEFIANMSHDIRTPLTGVIGMSKIIEDNATDKDQKEYAHLLGESGDRLLHMLNDILDVISADNTKESDLHEDSFDLKLMIQDIYKLEHPSTVVKNINFNLNVDEDIPKYLVGDKNKLQRILLNLLGNAIKFTEKGKVLIIISLLKKERKKAILRFEISDTGIGIETELLDKIFDRFFRVSPSYKSIYTGHGVGLHIAQSYAHLLGTKIKVSSKLNVGTTFYFDLSMKIAKVAQRTKPNYKNISLVEKIPENMVPLVDNIKPNFDLLKNIPNLLLIEDNITALKVLEILVSKVYCKSTGAADGEIGLKLAKQNHYDLIITDLGLPKLSGIDFTCAIREYEMINNMSPTPIIGLTAHADDKTRQDCLKAGMNDVFSKPLDLNILEKISHTYLTNDIVNGTPELEKLGGGLPDTENALFELDNFLIFDANLALEIIGGDESILISILQEFIDIEIPSDIKDMQHAYAKRDWAGVEKLAHKIKGGVEYCGTVKLKYACQYLERYHKAGHIKYLEELYQQLLWVKDETIFVVVDWLAKHLA